ncbi:MAG TPA: hypothetical protein VFI02_17155, partial [Armatimonadota bacterium]|nr:hypothetical protein [Armatimonadota bacterium]
AMTAECYNVSGSFSPATRHWGRLCFSAEAAAGAVGIDLLIDRLSGVGFAAYDTDGDLYVARTNDWGKSFESPIALGISGEEPSLCRFGSSSRHWGIVYNVGTALRLVESKDDFATISEVTPMTITGTHARARVHPLTGIMLIAFYSGENIWCARSTDNGQTLSTPTMVVAASEQAFGLDVSMDARNIWVITYRDDESEICTRWSADNGLTWHVPA